MMITPLHIASPEGQAAVAALLSRFQEGDNSPRQAVADIIQAVRDRGDEALVGYCRQYDAPKITAAELAVRPEEITAAYHHVDDDFRATLALAIRRIRDFHEREMEDSWIQTRDDGVVVGRLVRPADSAGLYVPGGKGGSTPLVSSVLMNGIPALIAGVPRLVMVTPPDAEGRVSPHLLVAAAEIGIKEIYKIGSAWAVAALAYGTATVPGVDVIVGPGNQFVTEAKRQVSGRVRIDMIAGPSEVLIVADSSAQAAHVAADMLAQAEHDPQALAVVITTEKSLAAALPAELARQLEKLSRREIAEQSLAERGCVLIAENIGEAMELANKIAIEHLELMLAEPWLWLPKVRHAGAIFLGGHTPEAAGDYLAGPNHVLPTMGTARFASALGVDIFLKKSSIISYSREALVNDAAHIQRLARLEGLTGHANSVAVRI